jgi:hypothetical protein
VVVVGVFRTEAEEEEEGWWGEGGGESERRDEWKEGKKERKSGKGSREIYEFWAVS